MNIDAIVRSQKTLFYVIPADPGSRPGQAPESRNTKDFWTPAFAGVTALRAFYEGINIEH